MTALRDIPTAALVGLAALAFSVLYLISDVIEALQGRFSGSQLELTLIAEAAIPDGRGRPRLPLTDPARRPAGAAAIRDLGFAGMGAALLGAHALSGQRPAAYPG
jgi:hypothetical protein